MVFKKNKYLLFTILLTFLMISIVFLCYGIYPFGKNVFSCIDFDHAYVPVYYKLWDVLHGKSSMLFDWNLGVGLNCFGSLIGNSLLSPTSWLIVLFKRSFISYAMNYIIMIKLVEVSIITYISISKLFSKVNDFYKMIFTITYTFCGWTAFMLSSFLYVDVFALFPLFVLAYYRLLKDNKWLMYIIVLTLCLMFNYYMSYQILFFIIGVGVLGLFTLDIKDKKKKAVEILLLTILSLGLSCVSFLPAVHLAFSSTRMASADVNNYTGFYIGEFFLKVIYILPMSLPIYFTFKQLREKKEKKNINLFFILILIYTLIGIIIPKINAMWHTGSYSGLPFRYAYIPSFVLICIALYYLENHKEKDNNNSIVYFILALIVNIIIVVFAYIFRKDYVNESFINDITKLSQFVAIFILFIFSLFCINISLKNKKIFKYVSLTIFTISYLLIYFLYFIGLDETIALSRNTQEVKSELKLPNDNYNYLIESKEININAPYILERPSMQNRIHFINQEMADFSNYLGYEKMDTLILGHGGNLFTNLIKMNKYVLAYNKMNDKLYEVIDSNGEYYLNASKYNLNYIIPYNRKIYNKRELSIANNTNNIYQTIFEKKEPIMHIIKDNKITLLPGNEYYFETTLDDNSKLLKKMNNNYSLVSNDNLNIIIVQVSKKVSLSIDPKEYDVSYINIDEFIDFVKNNNNYNVNVKTTGNKREYQYNNDKGYKSILIPINYDKGYRIKVNGKSVNYKSNIYNMVSIDVDKGKNEIEIVYIPKMLKEGIIVSLVSLIILLLVYFTNKKIKYLDNVIILNTLFIFSFIIGIGFILKIYVLFWF